MQKVRQFTGDIPGWTVDYEADAAYMQLIDRPVAETISYDLINVDLDSHGCVVGVEILTLSPEHNQQEATK